MNHQRTSNLLLRTGAAFVAAFGITSALVSVSSVHASTVTLTGSTSATCTYTAVTGSAAGDFTFTCGTVAPQPGTLSLSTASASIPVGGNTTITVNRSAGTSGAVTGNLAVTGAGACTLSAPSISFAEATSTPVPSVVTVTTAGIAGTSCIVTLTAAGGALVGSPSQFTANVVNPDANVTFQFSTTTSTATFGGGTVPVVVTRTGGTNGSFDVPILIGNTMTTIPGGGGALLAGGGTMAPSISGFTTVLTFAPNSQSQTINYTPPATPPVGVTSPGYLVLALFGTVVPTPAAPPPQNGQTGSLGANVSNVMTVSTATGCLTSATFTTPWTGSYLTPTLKPGETQAVSLAIGTYPLTGPPLGLGKFTAIDNPSTGSLSDIQFAISDCPGDFSRPAPCTKHTQYSGGLINFYVGTVPTGVHPFLAAQYCGLPAGTTTVYFNLRQVKLPVFPNPLPNPPVPSCIFTSCQFIVQYN